MTEQFLASVRDKCRVAMKLKWNWNEIEIRWGWNEIEVKCDWN